jgi:hypothetical protein
MFIYNRGTVHNFRSSAFETHHQQAKMNVGVTNKTSGEMESTLARYERELHGMRHVVHGGRWGSSVQYCASAGCIQLLLE